MDESEHNAIASAVDRFCGPVEQFKNQSAVQQNRQSPRQMHEADKKQFMADQSKQHKQIKQLQNKLDGVPSWVFNKSMCL